MVEEKDVFAVGDDPEYNETVEPYDELLDDEDYDFEIEQKSSAGAWSSLVLGVIASVAWIIPIIGIPITIVGIVFGAINFKSDKAKGAAIGGFVVNIVFLLVAIAKGVLEIIKIFRNK